MQEEKRKREIFNLPKKKKINKKRRIYYMKGSTLRPDHGQKTNLSLGCFICTIQNHTTFIFFHFPVNRCQCSITRKFLLQTNLTKNLVSDQNGGKRMAPQKNQGCQTNPLKFEPNVIRPTSWRTNRIDLLLQIQQRPEKQHNIRTTYKQ